MFVISSLAVQNEKGKFLQIRSIQVVWANGCPGEALRCSDDCIPGTGDCAFNMEL